MATVTPTLTLSSTDALVDTLSLSVSDSLSISGQAQLGKTLLTGSLVTLFTAADFGHTMVYLKNLSTSTSSRTKTTAPDGAVVAFGANEELVLAAGEFAMVPWDGSADLKVKHNGTGSAPYLEFAIFEF